jgi:hypothetical protein
LLRYRLNTSPECGLAQPASTSRPPRSGEPNTPYVAAKSLAERALLELPVKLLAALVEPKLSVRSGTLLLPRRLALVLNRRDSDAQNLSGGGGAPRRKRRSSYDGDAERLRCRDMTKSRSPVAAEGMWAQQESSDSEPDDSAAWLPAVEAGAEQQERSRSKNGPSSSP